MAGKSGKPDDRFLWESWAGVIGSLGLASILIVIIGRLWTTTYFDHFGLPSSGMEFTIYDFAFRSLEALISLVLGAIGFSIAWLIRRHLKSRGFLTAVAALAVAGLLVAWVFYFLPGLPDSWLAKTGVLGLSGGLTLAAMVWLGVDIWVGPGGGVKNWPNWLRNLLDALLKGLRLGDVIALAVLLFAGLLAAWVIVGLPRLSDSWVAKAGILGLSSGLAVAAMVWFGVGVWALRRGGVENWPNWLRNRRHCLLWRLRLRDPDKVKSALPYGWRTLAVAIGLAIFFPDCLLKSLGDLKKVEPAVPYGWRIIAAAIFLAIGFAYLPVVSEHLARIEAAADVATGEFAAAILESSEDPLPDAIASSDDPSTSNPVRVILTQSQNTYVLHSTDCTTIGELDVRTSVEGFLPAEAPEVCKVFTIPTARLKSIEYFQVSGKAPSNESMLRPRPVALGDTPFKESFSSGGASDEEELSCRLPTEGEEETDFFNSVWFEFTPATDGAVLTRVETAEFRPAVGIWAAAQGAIDVELVVGSGGEGLACEAEAATVPEPAPEPGANQERTKDVVGVVANVQAGTRYVASVGAQEDGGGLGRVSFEFWPGGYFSDPAIAALRAQALEAKTVEEEGTAAALAAAVLDMEDLVCQAHELVPRVEIVSGTGEAELELWRLDPETYEPQCLADIPEDERGEFLKGEFALEFEDERRPFVHDKSQDEQQPMVLHARGLTEGVWTLALPEGFVGLTRLSVTVYPDLMLAFADTSGTPLEDARVQQAVLVVLEESGIREELGYRGNVVFDRESFEERLQVPRVIQDREFSARMLLQGEGYEEGFPIQIQVEGESETLDAAAEIVQQRLLAIGLDARIEPCTDACIRVFFRTGDQG